MQNIFLSEKDGEEFVGLDIVRNDDRSLFFARFGEVLLSLPFFSRAPPRKARNAAPAPKETGSPSKEGWLNPMQCVHLVKHRAGMQTRVRRPREKGACGGIIGARQSALTRRRRQKRRKPVHVCVGIRTNSFAFSSPSDSGMHFMYTWRDASVGL